MTREQIREEYELEEMLYSRHEDAEEIEYVDCILCMEAADIEIMSMIHDEFVCPICMGNCKEENTNIRALVLKEKRYRAEKRAVQNMKVSQINISELQRSIKVNCKPIKQTA